MYAASRREAEGFRKKFEENGAGQPRQAANSLQQLRARSRRLSLGAPNRATNDEDGNPSMARSKSKPSRPKRRRPKAQPTGESQTGDAATVAWTMAVTTVLLCDVAAVFSHLLARAWPDERGLGVFHELMLFAATVAGAVSLLLLPVVLRVRRLPPPLGFVVFGVCAAVAPMLALVVRALR
jgi:hypothetical protein